MAGSGQPRRRGIARLLALCAVLFGLFLMHGAPATAAEGCHGATAPTGVHEDPHAMRSATVPMMTHPSLQQASGSAAMDGTTCVSTPARDTTPLTTPGLLAVVTVLASVLLARNHLAQAQPERCGPPPPGGRSLLLQVCIART
ncbi:hypothetical protein [Streptomyces sp. H39-S7]|uniref:hypothetical protein n=1 Tax=Streptomyces sp. H39-S7 TaxID=3004357 RepID=UPI0022AE7983|nr:hypothetical protein [Streptomyces sp. H39-S7]MCZ4124042.1 hypothetical protein [Streptomyces sp. H39-S7]